MVASAIAMGGVALPVKALSQSDPHAGLQSGASGTGPAERGLQSMKEPWPNPKAAMAEDPALNQPIQVPVLAQAPSTIDQLLQSKACKGCNLTNANLSGLDLSGVDLSGADLSNADLSGATLTGADLSGANLYLAKLANSTLLNAKLIKANLTGTKAEKANLSNADLSDATLSYANLTGATLTGANLSGAKASDAILIDANLDQANLTQAKLSNADLSGATFAEANLTNALLTNANLSGANLQTANLVGANLAGAKLIQANLPPDLPVASSGTPTTPAEPEKDAYIPTPLEKPPIRLFNLDTANQLPKGAVSFTLGFRNFFNSQGSQGDGGGFGRQVASFRGDGGVSDRLQLGLAGDLFSDSLLRKIDGERVNLKYFSAAAQAKYQFLKADKLQISVAGSAELLNIRTDTTAFFSGVPLGNSFSGKTVFAGSIQVPLTYSLSDQFQVHLTPGVSFFPDSFKGAPFYGTVFNIGAGVSWQPLKRLNLFADIHVPLGPGGNSLRAGDASIFKSVVWSGGLRFLVNPAVGLDIYATNAFGTTPATQILTFMPGGDQVAIAAVLNFTPEIAQNYAPDFRNKARVTLTPRDQQLLLDGFTIPTADTLLPRTIRVRAGTGAGTGGNIATGLTNDVQIEFLAESYDGPIRNGIDPEPVKLGGAAKIRFLDQVQGDPFSLSARVTFAQTLTQPNGFSEGGIIFQYRPIPQLALIFEPKAGIFGSDERFGTGLGFNLQLWKGLQLIGEYTPVLVGEGKIGVWSAGLRYLDPKLGLGFDVYGSNAAGLNSIGTLIGRPDPSVGFNIHWLFNP
jgi:uncharacterized protein YjbI with pentapeptide repeats